MVNPTPTQHNRKPAPHGRYIRDPFSKVRRVLDQIHAPLSYREALIPA